MSNEMMTKVVAEALERDKGFSRFYAYKGGRRERMDAVGYLYKVGGKVMAARYTDEGKIRWRLVSSKDELKKYPDWFVTKEGCWEAVIIRRYYTVNVNDKGIWKNYQTRLVIVEGPYAGKIVSVVG